MATNAFAAGLYAATQGLTGLGPAKKPAGAAGGEFGALLQNAVSNFAEAGRKTEAQALAVANGKADVVVGHDDAYASFQYQMQLDHTRLYYAGGTPTVNLFNPIAWAQFLQAWQNGAYKKKD